MVGIYKITSPSGKVYIGQTWDFKDRVRRYRLLQSKKQVKLHASLVKYGFGNHSFRMVHELPQDVDQASMDTYEVLYMEQHKECGFTMMNIRGGGRGGKMSEETKEKLRAKQTGKKMSLDAIEKIRRSKIGKPSPLRGVVKSEEAKAKSRAAQIGKKLSPERIALSMAGRKPLSEETRTKLRLNWAGRKHSDESRAKMKLFQANRPEGMNKNISLGKIGHTVSEETRKKISEKLKGRKHSEETLLKLKARVHSEETRAKMSEAQKNRYKKQ